MTGLCGAPDCANPAADGAVCWSCMGELRGALRSVPEVLDELMVTITRQDQGERGVGGGSEEPPLLFRPEASETARDLHSVLDVWTRHVLRALGLTLADVHLAGRPDIRRLPPGVAGPERPPVPGQRTVPERWREPTTSGRFPGPDTVELARWLERHPDTIRRLPAAGTLCDEISDAVSRCRRATDRPGPRVYLGPCVCSVPEHRVDLYARPDGVWTTCRECGARWDVDERRLALLTRSAHHLVTAEVATRALPQLLGYELTYDMIRNLVRRWGLPRHPPLRWDELARPRYRIGDIVDATARRAEALMARRAAVDARPPIEDLPPDLAELFTAVRAAALSGSIDSTVRDG